MRILVLMLILAFSSSCATTHFKNGVEVKKENGFLGALVYKQDGETIHRPQLADGLEQSLATREAMSGYQTPSTLRHVFGFAGGLMIGWPIGQKIANVTDPNWTLAWIGAGLAVVSVIFEGIANRQLDRAVDVYNHSLAGKPAPKKAEVSPSFYLTQIGQSAQPTLGLSVRY